jgi:hypothetical protein
MDASVPSPTNYAAVEATCSLGTPYTQVCITYIPNDTNEFPNLISMIRFHYLHNVYIDLLMIATISSCLSHTILILR